MSEQTDAILDNIDPIDLMEPYVDLKEINPTTYSGICPFHDDKTPSFFVNPEKNGVYHCFGCGESGNIITFLEKMENKDYIQVMQELSKITGLTFNSTGISKEYEKRKHLNELMTKLQSTFEFALTHRSKTKSIYENILKKRKMTFDELSEFHIGYSDQNILNGFMNANNISAEDKIKTGTYRIDKSGEIYTTLNKRITFTLRKLNGDKVGFTGERTLSEAYQKSKYKITVPSNIKKNYFYYIGDRLNSNQPIYLCEGLYDVISLKLANIANPISTLGTNVTNDQINSLLSKSNKFILCYDGDKPGINAAIHIYHQLNEAYQFDDLSIKFIKIPDNMDPDDYRKAKGINQFKQFVNKPLTPIEFVINIFNQKVHTEQLSTTNKIKKLLKLIMSYTQDKIEQDVYLNNLSKKVGINKSDLIQYYKDDQKKIQNKKIRENSKSKNIKQKEFINKDKPTLQSNPLDLSNILNSNSKNSFDNQSQVENINYTFDGILYLREEAIINYLLNYPDQIKFVKANESDILYHTITKKLFNNLYEEYQKNKRDLNKIKDKFITKIKSQNNAQEILLDKILKLNIDKKEYLSNLKLLNIKGKQCYNNEITLNKLSKISDINELNKLLDQTRNK